RVALEARRCQDTWVSGRAACHRTLCSLGRCLPAGAGNQIFDSCNPSWTYSIIYFTFLELVLKMLKRNRTSSDLCLHCSDCYRKPTEDPVVSRSPCQAQQLHGPLSECRVPVPSRTQNHAPDSTLHTARRRKNHLPTEQVRTRWPVIAELYTLPATDRVWSV